jgi:hypothetical protein
MASFVDHPRNRTELFIPVSSFGPLIFWLISFILYDGYFFIQVDFSPDFVYVSNIRIGIC